MVGNKMYPGALTSDQLKQVIDSMTAAAAAAAPAPAAPAPGQ
jgi:ribosomal protein L12E/L44/L45/RPP1/RPP2